MNHLTQNEFPEIVLMRSQANFDQKLLIDRIMVILEDERKKLAKAQARIEWRERMMKVVDNEFMRFIQRELMTERCRYELKDGVDRAIENFKKENPEP